MSQVLYVIEIKSLTVSSWHACNSGCFRKKDALQDLANWKLANPDDNFRITKYVPYKTVSDVSHDA